MDDEKSILSERGDPETKRIGESAKESPGAVQVLQNILGLITTPGIGPETERELKARANSTGRCTGCSSLA